jgi:hypothetical protein
MVSQYVESIYRSKALLTQDVVVKREGKKGAPWHSLIKLFTFILSLFRQSKQLS